MLPGVEAKQNPDYLRETAQAVDAFRVALEEFLKLHRANTSGPRGVAPAVIPLDDVDAAQLDAARLKVDLAAGRASAAPGLTGLYYNVADTGRVDPTAVWHSVTLPKPVLEPNDILSACGQMVGRLEQMALKAEAEAPPMIGAEAMHPLIWGAARALWRDGHFRQAVAAAAEALVSQVKSRTGRNDVPETALWQEAFSSQPPEPSRPRLRWPGDASHRDVKAMTDGLRQFAPGAQMTIRNAAVHGTAEMGEQDALERLAVLSLLARWVEQCELTEYCEPAPRP